MRGRSLAIGAAVVAAAGGATMTARAAWSGTAAVDAGTVQSGSISLAVGAGGVRVHEYVFGALGGSNLAPGAVRQAPLSVSNDGTVALRYRSTGVEWGALAGQASASWVRVAAQAACPAAGDPVAQPGDVTVPRVLEPGQTEVWCVRVTLGASPPQGLVDAPVRFEFAAEQARHGG